MTDPAVGGVDHFIYEESRQSADEQPERRSDNAVIEAFGGKIWFESEENLGSKFYITLPLAGVKKKSGTKGLEANT